MSTFYEPEAEDRFPSNTDEQLVALASIAVSVRRIADLLCDPEAAGLRDLLSKLSTQPVNQYGEGLSEAIQNSIVRGQRGISTVE